MSLQFLQEEIEHSLNQIRRHFKADHNVQLSLVIRNATLAEQGKDGDIYVSNDNPAAVIEVIQRRTGAAHG